MLELDRGRYIGIQSGAVALAGKIDAIIGEWLHQGARNLFFAGTGGAAILMQPAAQMLQRASAFPVHADITAELVAGGHGQLGPQSIVVIPSVSGTTKESVELVELCKAKGAKVLSLVGHAGTPLARDATATLVNFAEDDTSCENFYIQSLLVALSVLHHRGEIKTYAATVAELKTLPELLLGVKDQFRDRAEKYAAEIEREPLSLDFRRRKLLARGLVFRHVYSGGNAVGENPSRACRGFLPWALGTHRERRECRGLQGRGYLSSIGRARRTLRQSIHRQALRAGYHGLRAPRAFTRNPRHGGTRHSVLGA